MKHITSSFCSIVILIFLAGCHHRTAEVPKTTNTGMRAMASPPVLIYKTRADYNKLVPVGLSDDRQTVISYPDRKDLYFEGEFAYPVQLADGYLLDRRGIGPNAAFLSLTYEEYAALPATPGPEELIKQIKDFDPFTQIFNCGNRYQFKDVVSEINQKIKKGDFSGFTKLK